MPDAPKLWIAWTSLSSREDAEGIARQTVEQGLAACVQLDGPIRSTYRWQGQLEQTEEWRLCFKLLPEQAAALEALVHRLHPYKVPEWLCVEAAQVSEKYLSWARSSG